MAGSDAKSNQGGAAGDGASGAGGGFVAWAGSGVPLILFTLLSWASIPLFLRQLSGSEAQGGWGLDPFAANAWRYGISAAFWLPFLIIAWRRGKLPPVLFKLALVPVLFNVVGQSFFAWGPKLLDPGFFSFVFRVQVVFVTLGAYLLFPEERGALRSPRYWFGLAGVVGGSVGLILLADRSVGNVSTLGVVVALASGVLFAGYGMAVRYFVSGLPPIIAFGVICQFTALGVIAVGFATGPSNLAHVFSWNAWQIFTLVASAFIGIAISHVAYYASLKRLGVSVSMGIIQLQPVLTAAGSMVIFNERLNTWQWCAGLLGVCGAVLMLTTGKKIKTDEAEG
jgi:drug/metabolite transporter (DMT)-like permease